MYLGSEQNLSETGPVKTVLFFIGENHGAHTFFEKKITGHIFFPRKKKYTFFPKKITKCKTFSIVFF